jgi:hypothetical protein
MKKDVDSDENLSSDEEDVGEAEFDDDQFVIPEGMQRFADLAGIDEMDDEIVAARLVLAQKKVDIQYTSAF